MEKDLKRRKNASYWVGKKLLEYLKDQSGNNLI